MERKIGKIFDFEGNKLEVIENNSCEGCFFRGKGACGFRINIVGNCSLSSRSDCKSIIFRDITNMKEEINEIKITVPEGMEIDKENSTFECIIFKKKEEIPWRNKKENRVNGYWIDRDSNIIPIQTFNNIAKNHNVFATEKQAKSALAMAQISQIMANDERFGGVVTDKEWLNDCKKYIIIRHKNKISFTFSYNSYRFLAFRTPEQRDLFFNENEDLVKDYLMIE